MPRKYIYTSKTRNNGVFLPKEKEWHIQFFFLEDMPTRREIKSFLILFFKKVYKNESEEKKRRI